VTTSSDIAAYVYQIGFGPDLLGVPLVMPVLHPAVDQSFQGLRAMESYSSGHWQRRECIRITDKFRATQQDNNVSQYLPLCNQMPDVMVQWIPVLCFIFRRPWDEVSITLA